MGTLSRIFCSSSFSSWRGRGKEKRREEGGGRREEEKRMKAVLISL
jgi:hypothetical protein